jgi:IS30 family transposase
VSREVIRHGGRSSYRALNADKQAWKSALRPNTENRKLRETVAVKLVLDWSPEQISGWLKKQYPDAVSIRERPAEAEDRAVPGHWEGDLLSGGKNTYIATLVERHSRFAMLVKVPGKDIEAVVRALSRQVRKLPASLRRSLKWDRGLEMAKHKRVYGSH